VIYPPGHRDPGRVLRIPERILRPLILAEERAEAAHRLARARRERVLEAGL
jgi:hypothetical protein